MKKSGGIFLAATLLLGATGMVAAQPSLSMAVYDFKGEVGAAAYGSKVAALVTASLAANTNLIVLERAKLKKALSEQAFGVSGLVSSDAAAEIGQITGAKVLVSGEVMMTGQKHLVIIANIIGTETGRLFAAKAEGDANDLLDLCSGLAAKITETISTQAASLATSDGESSAARLEQILKSITGTNRPAISLDIFSLNEDAHYTATANVEFGILLLKAGFPVVDAHSERKPDIEIKGLCDHGQGPRRGELFSNRVVIELKVQERQTGNIILIDRQETTATGPSNTAADRAAQVRAVDELAERVLPLLAK